MTNFTDTASMLAQMNADYDEWAECMNDSCSSAQTALAAIEAKNAESIGLVNAMLARINAVDDSSLIDTVATETLASVIPPNMLKNGGTFADKVAAGGTTGDCLTYFTDESDILSPYNGSTLQNGGTYHNNSSAYGGSNLKDINASITAFLNTLVDNGRSTVRYGTTFNQGRLNAGTGTASSRTVGGIKFYRMCGTNVKMVSRRMTSSYWIRVAGNPVVVDAAKINGIWQNSIHTNVTQVLTSGTYHIVEFINTPIGYARLLNLFGTNDFDSGGDYSRAYINFLYVSTGHINVLPENHLTPIPSNYLIQEMA